MVGLLIGRLTGTADQARDEWESGVRSRPCKSVWLQECLRGKEAATGWRRREGNNFQGGKGTASAIMISSPFTIQLCTAATILQRTAEVEVLVVGPPLEVRMRRVRENLSFQ